MFSTCSSSWDPAIAQYSVFNCCCCATSAAPSVSKGGIYSTGFRRKVGMCHLTDAVKVYTDLEMFWDNNLQVSQLSQASQRLLTGEEKREVLRGEEACCWWGLWGCCLLWGGRAVSHSHWKRVPDVSVGRKGIMAWPLHYGVGISCSSCGLIEFRRYLPWCWMRQEIYDQRRGWSVRYPSHVKCGEMNASIFICHLF